VGIITYPNSKKSARSLCVSVAMRLGRALRNEGSTLRARFVVTRKFRCGSQCAEAWPMICASITYTVTFWLRICCSPPLQRRGVLGNEQKIPGSEDPGNNNPGQKTKGARIRAPSSKTPFHPVPRSLDITTPGKSKTTLPPIVQACCHRLENSYESLQVVDFKPV